jgi:hypothetical protein
MSVAHPAAGKTTALRTIAGLEEISRQISIAIGAVNNLRRRKRHWILSSYGSPNILREKARVRIGRSEGERRITALTASDHLSAAGAAARGWDAHGSCEPGFLMDGAPEPDAKLGVIKKRPRSVFIQRRLTVTTRTPP